MGLHFQPVRLPAILLVSLLLASPASAQEEEVTRLVAQAQRLGDEAAVAHLGEEIGPDGIAQCLEHASRSGRLLCAQAARHLLQPWPVLPTLAGVLRSHDRELASRAAESMVVILSTFEAGQLGQQEALPAEVESLLRALGRVVGNDLLSPDVRAQAVDVAGALARIAGAGLAVPRAALQDGEAAVRRAAIAAVAGSAEPEDLTALVAVVEGDEDLTNVALASAGVCEATLGAGRPIPAPAAERIRRLLEDRRARLSLVHPILACLARAPEGQTPLLRQLAERHPDETIRQAWLTLTSPADED